MATSISEVYASAGLTTDSHNHLAIKFDPGQEDQKIERLCCGVALLVKLGLGSLKT